MAGTALASPSTTTGAELRAAHNTLAEFPDLEPLYQQPYAKLSALVPLNQAPFSEIKGTYEDVEASPHITEFWYGITTFTENLQLYVLSDYSFPY